MGGGVRRGAGERRTAVGRWKRSIAALLASALAAALWLPGCASKSSDGFHHTVRSGENLYRIGLRYGVPHDVLRRVNEIRDEKSLRVGTRLWIPGSGKQSKSASRASQVADAKRLATKEAQRDGRLAFRWPLKGRLTSSFGLRGGRPHEGIDLAAPRGSAVRAAEAGRVIYSGRLGAYGRCVIVKHAGHYRSVYAHATKTLVRKGQFVDQGQKIATVGSTGRATGPHLHFEIRRSETPHDPMLYLP